MRVHFCGVRGSTPSPGEAFLRYGGNTSCVAIARDGEPPPLVLDAGTGLRTLSAAFDGAPFRGTILLGHLHWDHTHGIPFFRAGDQPGARVHLMMPAQGDPAEVMARVMSPPHFPIRIDELQGEWTLEGFEPGRHDVEGFEVIAAEIPHKNGRTFGYRIRDGSATIAYLSDHWPTALGPGEDGLGAYHDAALALASGVDLLIHDAQYTAGELPARGDFGHAAVEYAVGLAERARVRTLALFHHDPDRTDDEIDALVGKHAGAGVTVTAPAEGSMLDV